MSTSDTHPGLRQRTHLAGNAPSERHPVDSSDISSDSESSSACEAHDRQAHNASASGSSQPQPPPVVPAPEGGDTPTEERQCRICFAGEDEEPELGRLFRPCRCKGSMKYVHVECLNRWRKSSASRTAFWACNQCGYKYTLARTRAIGLANSPALLGITTATLFTCIVFLSSFIATYFVPDLNPSRQEPLLAETNSGWSFYSYASSSNPTEYIRLAVQTFNDIAFDGALDLAVDPDFGLFEKWTWKLTTSPEDMERERRKRRARRAFQAARSRHPDKNAREKEEQKPPLSHGWIYSLFQRFVLGLSFVGILSFLNLIISLSLYAPLQFVRGGRRGLFGTRRDRANGKLDMGTILIFVFVAIGVARAVYKIYQLNLWFAHALLSRAETAILEVQEADEADVDDKLEPFYTRLWRRASATMTGLGRHLRQYLGDPLEPWYFKLGRLIYRMTIWSIAKVFSWWQRFGAVDVM